MGETYMLRQSLTVDDAIEKLINIAYSCIIQWNAGHLAFVAGLSSFSGVIATMWVWLNTVSNDVL